MEESSVATSIRHHPLFDECAKPISTPPSLKLSNFTHTRKCMLSSRAHRQRYSWLLERKAYLLVDWQKKPG